MKNTIVVQDVYSYGEFINSLEFGFENIYHVSVGKYGYLHDVGIEIVLTRIQNGEAPTGWETLESDMAAMVNDIKGIWKLNSEFGYH